MRRIAVVMTGVAMLLALGLAVVACGEGIGNVDQPELRVETAELEVELGPSSRTRTVGDVQLRNTGPGDLKINNIEWVTRPDRVKAIHQGSLYDQDQSCSSDADCGGEGICTQAETCIDRGFRDISEPIPQRATFDQRLVITASDQVVTCPEPPNPDDAPDGYCGEIKIETNAPNDTDTGTGGVAHIYLIAEDASGLLEIPQQYNYLEFTGAEAGTAQTLELKIRNAAPNPLTIETALFQQNPTWFEISPSMVGYEIGAEQTETFTLEMTPPENANSEMLNFQSTLSFESTSVQFAPAITINVTDGPGDVPILEVNPGQLSFADGEPKTLSVENHGSATLQVFGMEIRPNSVQEHYSVTLDGQDALGGDVFPLSLPSGDDGNPTVREFEIELLNPDAETTVGDLRINHNDDQADNLTEVSLLGDATEVAIGEIEPSTVRFRSDGGGSDQQRLLSVSNTGTQPLEITSVNLEERTANTDAANYTIEGLETTVAAGDVAEATVTYSGETQTPQDLRVTAESNHAGQPTEMEFLVKGTDLTEPTMDISIEPSFTTDAAVGETATFTVEDASGEAELNLAAWYVHSRPSASEATLQGSGQEATMDIDAAGSYKISVVVRDGANREVQKIFEFDAVDS